jgi:predicted phosphodiesterase
VYLCTESKKKDMIKRYETFDQPIYIIGDIHGDFDTLKKSLLKYKTLETCVLIIAGDIGLGAIRDEYYQETFEDLNNLCLERHIQLFMVRGNHDNPSYFDEEKIAFSNVKSVPDYSVISVGDNHILCVGGGISIDRKNRIASFTSKVKRLQEEFPTLPLDGLKQVVFPTYWVDEAPYYDEEALNEINDLGLNIKYVVTHTSPDFCFKTNKDGISYYLNIDDELEDDLNYERGVFSSIYHKLKRDNHLLQTWVYGHFHDHNDEIIDNTRFVTLLHADYQWDCFTLYDPIREVE